MTWTCVRELMYCKIRKRTRYAGPYSIWQTPDRVTYRPHCASSSRLSRLTYRLEMRVVRTIHEPHRRDFSRRFVSAFGHAARRVRGGVWGAGRMGLWAGGCSASSREPSTAHRRGEAARRGRRSASAVAAGGHWLTNEPLWGVALHPDALRNPTG